MKIARPSASTKQQAHLLDTVNWLVNEVSISSSELHASCSPPAGRSLRPPTTAINQPSAPPAHTHSPIPSHPTLTPTPQLPPNPQTQSQHPEESTKPAPEPTPPTPTYKSVWDASKRTVVRTPLPPAPAGDDNDNASANQPGPDLLPMEVWRRMKLKMAIPTPASARPPTPPPAYQADWGREWEQGHGGKLGGSSTSPKASAPLRSPPAAPLAFAPAAPAAPPALGACSSSAPASFNRRRSRLAVATSALDSALLDGGPTSPIARTSETGGFPVSVAGSGLGMICVASALSQLLGHRRTLHHAHPTLTHRSLWPPPIHPSTQPQPTLRWLACAAGSPSPWRRTPPTSAPTGGRTPRGPPPAAPASPARPPAGRPSWATSPPCRRPSSRRSCHHRQGLVRVAGRVPPKSV